MSAADIGSCDKENGRTMAAVRKYAQAHPSDAAAG
jgi:hypothetical protein